MSDSTVLKYTKNNLVNPLLLIIYLFTFYFYSNTFVYAILYIIMVFYFSYYCFKMGKVLSVLQDEYVENVISKYGILVLFSCKMELNRYSKKEIFNFWFMFLLVLFTAYNGEPIFINISIYMFFRVFYVNDIKKMIYEIENTCISNRT